MVTIENWEEYAILKADGELDAAEATALESFLAAHPELQEEAKLYESLKLVPDEEVVFAGKEALLRPEPKVIALNTRWIMTAAAGVALLIGATLLLRNGGESSSDAGAAVARRVNAGTPQTAKKVPVALPVQQPRIITEESGPVIANKRNASLKTEIKDKPPVQRPAPIASPESYDLASLPLNESATLSVTDVGVRSSESQAVAALPQKPTPPLSPESNKLLDRLAAGEEKLRLVEDLTTVASNRIRTLRDTRDKLRNSDVTVQFASRKLFTIHL